VVRLGENHARPVNVRVIPATHRNLTAMVERGEFREDLYYQLRVLPLHVPALRERKVGGNKACHAPVYGSGLSRATVE
jgi:transcriptional regulator with GAF, ATPase, and Fis domain